MCFSPEVSFASAAALVPTGMWIAWAAGRSAPRLWPLAVVPAVFGLQQACEGLVWLGLRYQDEGLKALAGRTYLFFALAFWPFWFSATAALIEPPGAWRRLLVAWAALSTGWFWFAYLPVLGDPAAAGACVCRHSIRYQYADATAATCVRRVLYVLTAAVPLVLSSWRAALLPCVVLGVSSACVAAAVYDHAFTSVWCLFAAALSVSLARVVVTAPRRAPALNLRGA
ncbi:DUF6629 family protein [Gemmata sp. JC717]|uniref:DUF6629 family protein n=1 Tax=Gemmata algarum TaxID=2975278 RepID=UPI0021BA8B94|nr:DUF6629 family protein [Gemmata algarum]MDY3552499.1 DUF6629 family protein [Gemmata algarum]